MAMSEARVVELSYRLNQIPDDWELPDEVPVPPESRPHDLTIDRLRSLLNAWIARTKRDAIVTRNLAVRWVKERPNVGIDPDVALIEPTPPDADELLSLKLWKPGNPVPRFAVEVVSPTHPYKDYGVVQERYAAFGVGELIVLDARLRGPKKLGGPFAIQVWRFDADHFSRVYAGPGPAHSVALDAWISFDDLIIQVSDDAATRLRWPTEVEVEQRRSATLEAERNALEAKQAANEAERASLEQRVRELEERLKKR